MNDTKAENWEPIAGYEGRYEVSDQGRVRAVPRMARHGRGSGLRKYKGGVLKGGTKPAGYPYVNLYDKDNVPRVHYVHHLVLNAFVGEKPFDAAVARHLNDVKNDNRVENLAWGTESDNSFDKVKNGNDHYASRTHCVNGHEFTPENIYRRAEYPGTRYCRQCRKDRDRAHADKKAEYKKKWRQAQRAKGLPVT